jgi:hypothetical protein
MSDFRPQWDAQTGDIYDDGHGNIVRITRRSRFLAWCDVVVIAANGAVWTKRMPAGIPVTWGKLPRR